MSELVAEEKTNIKASLKNDKFVSLTASASLGDVVKTYRSNLELVKVFTGKGGVYERRVSPTVLIRKTYPAGKLFKKTNSNAMIFIPEEQYHATDQTT